MHKKITKVWIKTENRIKSAVIELLNEIPAEGMNVKNICTKANIPRSTFYSHFANTSELFTAIRNDNLEQIKKKYVDNRTIATGPKFFIPLLIHIRENKNLFKVVLSTFHYDYTKQLSGDMIIDYFKNIYNSRAAKEYLMMYYIIIFHSSLISCLRFWIENDCIDPDEEIAQIIYECMPDKLKI